MSRGQTLPRWQALCEKFAALTRREQWLIALTGWIGLLFIGVIGVIEPQFNALSQAEANLVTQRNAVVTNRNSLILLARQLAADPNADIDARITQLQQATQTLDSQLGDRIASLVTPTEMVALMEQVLLHSSRLTLEQLISLPPEKLPVGESQTHGYYIHPLKLTFRGRYFDVAAYLAALEALPVKYYWQSLHYQVEAYPWASVELVVYTLGESEDFIGG
ncbi:MSHA biogenesis protein MshJ [Photobacterium aphoticum]|uniref:MSHA biogenesis protein MshJ n=2 Tax=Photobacterium aphoticum TaxID=754436 RepID=A0A0J1GSV4_9GAMM|nr:MSHA biogenesis protein MshJ [Photobacterium aphoticum]KLV02731.1 MSHA biogenesis protein MshJ [Photobacterium aphoticum]GHA54626.1 MSHA biogenesis protein MshJ [Photobacterium aphoticum]